MGLAVRRAGQPRVGLEESTPGRRPRPVRPRLLVGQHLIDQGAVQVVFCKEPFSSGVGRSRLAAGFRRWTRSLPGGELEGHFERLCCVVDAAFELGVAYLFEQRLK